MDRSIDVDRWICAAEEEICDVDGALNALGACQTAEGIEIHDLANIDAPGMAAYLKRLAERLQTVATNLSHLAEHADLTELAASLKSPHPTPVSASNIQHLDAGCDTHVSEASPGSSAGTGPGLVSREVGRLLAQLEEPVPPVPQVEGGTDE